MRTIDDEADLAALLRDQFAQARMHGLEHRQVVIATGDAGLVGSHRDGPAGLAQAGDGPIELGMGIHSSRVLM